MKTIIAGLSSLLLAATIQAVNVTISWDASPAVEAVTGYVVHQASNVSGPFTAVRTVTTTNTVFDLVPGQYYFYITASNFWGLALPSNTVSTPPAGSKVAGLKITR